MSATIVPRPANSWHRFVPVPDTTSATREAIALLRSRIDYRRATPTRADIALLNAALHLEHRRGQSPIIVGTFERR